MSAGTFLVTGATGETGRYTVQRLLEKGLTVRADVMVPPRSHVESRGPKGLQTRRTPRRAA